MAAPRPLLFGRGPLPWLVPALVAGGLVPLASLAIAAAHGQLGANPIAEAMNQLGLIALIFLVASLGCTPLRTATGWAWPIRVRKTLGLFAFFYAALHLAVYAALDQGLALRAIVDDVVRRPFITLGFAAFLLRVPLAVTSTADMLKRLGAARWKRLHRLAYLAAALGVAHFVLRVKRDLGEPVAYGTALAVLLLARVVTWAATRRAKGSAAL